MRLQMWTLGRWKQKVRSLRIHNLWYRQTNKPKRNKRHWSGTTFFACLTCAVHSSWALSRTNVLVVAELTECRESDGDFLR